MINKIFKKYIGYLSSIGFISGLIITPLTLNRIDNFRENLWVIIHIFIAILGIFLLNYLENNIVKGKVDIRHRENINFWLILIIQFAFGNLFSIYVVFYFRSSALYLSWPFVLLLSILLIGNELWKKHYSRLTMQLVTLFLSVYMFLIYFLPILFSTINDTVFVLSGVFSLIFIFVVIKILFVFAKESFVKSKKALIYSILGTFVIMNGMYFLNIIPPIPFALKDAGIYYNISKDIKGEYILNGETKTIRDYFRIYEIYHKKVGEPVYVFTSIFSPTKFDTEIIHEWQYYDSIKKKWISSNKITLQIVGGRDGGYRTYSLKENISEGLWRVNILTLKGKVIGRVNFRVE